MADELTGMGQFPQRKYEPLAAEHPLVGKVCPRCQTKFEAGDETTLVDPRQHPVGYSVTPVHWECR